MVKTEVVIDVQENGAGADDGNQDVVHEIVYLHGLLLDFDVFFSSTIEAGWSDSSVTRQHVGDLLDNTQQRKMLVS